MKQNNLSILHGKVIATDSVSTVFKSIVEIIDRYPQQVAIVHGSQQITYAQLNFRAAAFAAFLRSQEVKAESLIPICTNGGIDMIISMIAVWAVKCAFVPIDIHTPDSRLFEILKAVDSDVIIADAGVNQLVGYACINTEHCCTIDSGLTTEMGSDSDDLAYGFFTSGSTGTPKCCLNIHAGLINRMQVMSRYFNLAVGESVLQNSRHVFDSSLWQIFWPLSVGSQVVIPERDSIVDIDKTLNEIEKYKIVTTDFVPSILELVLQAIALAPIKAKKLASIHYLIVGGEAIDEQIVVEVHRYLPNVQLVNTYGPTEASIGMVIHLFDRQQSGTVPLGKPIDNTSVIVVDKDLHILPVGEIGEIVIGGRCLGLGYLNDSERTTQVFIDNTGLPMLDSDRIYRTGDLGHVGTNGLLYFNGRFDDQVKIAGIRVELGEIEHYMHTFAGIRQAKVVCVDSHGQQQLAGFFHAEYDVDIDELRRYLNTVLYRSIIPSLLLQIESFPRTTSGKIDANTLITKYCALENLDGQETDIRKTLLLLCQRFLPGNTLDYTTDLVTIGMDSLQLLNLSLEIEKMFGQQLPLWNMNGKIISIENLVGLLETQADTFNISADQQAQVNALLHDIEYWSFMPLSTKVITNNTQSNTVLLTGATGYVGVNILIALLKNTAYQVVCLIRGNNKTRARQRLKNSIDMDVDWSRIDVIVGDLNTLTTDILCTFNLHSIIHAAAEVNFMKNYTNLIASNVEATVKLSQLTVQLGLERLHYISTMGVFSTEHSSPEKYNPSAEILPHSGYSQSKWVAEAIVLNLAKKGLPVNIYRLGEMMPDTDAPKLNKKTVISILIKSALALNVIPKLMKKFNYTPITTVANHIAQCVKQTDSHTSTQIENLFHPDAIDLTTVIQAATYPKKAKVIDLKQFQLLITEQVNQNNTNENFSRAALILQSGDSLVDEAFTLHDDNQPVKHIEWSSLDMDNLTKMTACFQQ